MVACTCILPLWGAHVYGAWVDTCVDTRHDVEECVMSVPVKTLVPSGVANHSCNPLWERPKTRFSLSVVPGDHAHWRVDGWIHVMTLKGCVMYVPMNAVVPCSVTDPSCNCIRGDSPQDITFHEFEVATWQRPCRPELWFLGPKTLGYGFYGSNLPRDVLSASFMGVRRLVSRHVATPV